MTSTDVQDLSTFDVSRPFATSGATEPADRCEALSRHADSEATTDPASCAVTVQNVHLVESGSSAVYGPDQRQIGTVEQIYGSADGATPEWLSVVSDHRDHAGVLVPLAGARIDARDVIVAYTDDQLEGAPRILIDDELTPTDSARARAHYSR